MTLLDLRKKMKKKKPKFLRQLAYSSSKLKKCWRNPKGVHSKLRRKFKGNGSWPSMGYSSPKKVRGLNPKGLREILVYNLKGLEKIKEGFVVVIAKNIGMRKKLNILKKAEELKIKVYNIKDIPYFIKLNEEKFSKKKEEKKEKKQKKEKSKEESLKKAEEKKAEEHKETKEKKEKEEKRKVLEKGL